MWFGVLPLSRAAVSRGFERLLDAVVRIDVRELAFEAGAGRFAASVGSGVILSSDGLVLTNAHVASPRAVELIVTLASLERVNATLVGWDHWTDLALLRVDLAEVKRRGLTFTHAEFGDSSKLPIGETVYAVGTPFGLTRTATRGIISNNNRYFEDPRGVNGYETGTFNTWLQTDAAINPGNSGGPLVTSDGRVVGINSRGYAGADNMGFAIPAAIAKEVMAGLVRHGAIVRSYIGIVPRDLRDFEGFYALSLNTGLLINNVDRDSPAARAGIRGGDILLAVNGTKVDGRFPEQLPPIQHLIASHPVGSTLRLTIKRGAETRDYEVVTEQLESRVGEESVFERWGLSVRKVSRTYARENQLASAAGVLVIGVQPGFPAAVAGLSRGDIITAVNQQPVDTLETLKRAHTSYAAQPEPVLVEIMRDRQVSLCVFKP
ncbi:peptidase S1 and S6 chymotrypsin/Hap [Opitutus terrae PB90-1]|uniref:Peptidase S1 and S6 chymotrypsin/Hap n=2 Tax=Opitutus terrae TaxID=107709 RepID=B1ZZ69_OPITP|nr:peptidase S1 and S6 chymotrypsin/Hap [Opitutus terrae PB90-1]